MLKAATSEQEGNVGLGVATSGQWGAVTVVPEGGRVGLGYVSSVESTENGNHKETSVEQRSPAYVPPSGVPRGFAAYPDGILICLKTAGNFSVTGKPSHRPVLPW